MASFNRNFATSSPILAIQPQPAHRFPFVDRPALSHQLASFSHSAASSSQRPIPRSNSTFAGRKRSRDEASVNLDDPEKTAPVPSVEEREDEWEYGPGMVLIKKKTGYVPDASSQSGTWVEEKTAEARAKKAEAALIAQQHESQDRPSLRSNKSQRLDMACATAASQQPQASRSSPGRDAADSDATKAPVVDDFTLHLGIGWNQISSDEHIQAAARGWARFIENHFPVSGAKIRVESRGLQSYLVEAAEGYFLFSEDLRQGRLISKDSARALRNLKAFPPVFDGPQTMTAAESPAPESPNTTGQAPHPATADVDMELH